MLFDLKQAPGATKIILQAVKFKRPIPDALANAPRLRPWLEIFYLAFDDLLTERLWEEGPIPWSVRQKWAETHGLDEVATGLLHTHVKALHLAFMKHRSDTISRGGHGASAGAGDDARPSGVGEKLRLALAERESRRQQATAG